jgi:hypothetical protein
MQTGRYVIALFALAVVQGAALACPVCFGDPNDVQTAALNAAILTLLGITGFMLSTIGGSVALLVFRAKRREAERVTPREEARQ